MSTEKSYKKVRIFVGSPRDVGPERARVEMVVESLAPLAEHVGTTLELADWSTVVPDMGRPQQVIFNQLNPTTWDVFIGILWQRFGTPPGNTDSTSRQIYLSGTEEEFHVAYDLWRQYSRPRIMMYRCRRPVDPDTIDPEQLSRVKEFFAQFEGSKGRHPGYYQSFVTTDDFEKLLWSNLQKLILEFNRAEQNRPISEETLDSISKNLAVDNLPRRAPFFGRKEEIEKSLRALSPEDRGWGLVLNGIGGMGKSALAVEVAYLCKERGLFDAFVFVSAKTSRLEPEGIREQTPAAKTLEGFVDETARAIGQGSIANLPVESKPSALLDGLRSRRTLLIYDNVETLTEEEHGALVDFLRGLPQSCKAIITSRRRGLGEGAVELDLGRIDTEAANAIVGYEADRNIRFQRVNMRVGEVTWKEVIEMLGGSPLAILWTIGLLSEKIVPPESLVQFLREGSNRDSNLQKYVFEKVRGDLESHDELVLRTLSLFDPSARLEALTQTTNLSVAETEGALGRLSALTMVDTIHGDVERYSLHILTRNYIWEELVANQETLNAISSRFIRYWVGFATYRGNSSVLFGELEAEWANLEFLQNLLWQRIALKGSHVDDPQSASTLISLAGSLQHFLGFSGRWDERISLCTRAYELSCALKDWVSAGYRAHDVFWIYYSREQWKQAEYWGEKCEKAWQMGGFRQEQATTIRLRGLLAREQAKYEEAEKLLQEVLAIRREAQDSTDIATALEELGRLELMRQNYKVAEEYFRDALELGAGDVEVHATILLSLGNLASAQRLPQEAHKQYDEALTLAQSIGRQELVADAKLGLAELLVGDTDTPFAQSTAMEASIIYAKLGIRNHDETLKSLKQLEANTGAQNDMRPPPMMPPPPSIEP